MTKYTLEIEYPYEVPDDVLVEHLGQALKKLSLRHKVTAPPKPSVKIVAKNAYKLREGDGAVHNDYRAPRIGRSHPFDGPEVFDDDVTEHTTLDIMDQVFTAISQDFPHLSELFNTKRQEHNIARRSDLSGPPGEGDWTLPEDAGHVGEDL